MFHTIARLREKAKRMKRENNSCNGLEHVPACSTWPPPWLAEGGQLARKPPPMTALRVSAKPELSGPPPAFSSWDLPPDLYDRWQERVCIMHFDGWLPWQEAEALALANVLGQAEPLARPAPESRHANEPARAIQASLFNAENGPY
jgi:hypothetical protein